MNLQNFKNFKLGEVSTNRELDHFGTTFVLTERKCRNPAVTPEAGEITLRILNKRLQAMKVIILEFQINL